MKLFLPLATLLACATAAPLSGSGSFGAQPGNVSVDVQVRGFKAALYLFAPDSWITAFDAIPDAGQKCLFEAASNPANAQLYGGDDVQAIKQDLQSKCPESATELGAFSDATEQTMKALPQSFLDLSKSWAKQMQTLGEQAKQSFGNSQQAGAGLQQGVTGLQQAGQQAGQQGASTAQQGATGLQQAGQQAGQQGAAAFKQYLAQFAQATATFAKGVGALSETDRQQISDAFPKMQPFFSGEHATEFWQGVTQLYEKLGAGTNVDWASMKQQAAAFKDTLKSVWDEYKAENAQGLQQAGQILGKDLTQLDKFFDAQTSAQMGAQAGSGGFANFAQSHPEWSSKINEGIQAGKESFAENKQKLQNMWQEAKQSGSENLNELKQNAQKQWGDLKDKFGQNHSVSGSGSADANGVSANLGAN